MKVTDGIGEELAFNRITFSSTLNLNRTVNAVGDILETVVIAFGVAVYA